MPVSQKKPKPFLSYSQQIDKLMNDKNLQISNKAYAEETLKHISYFALISGYKDLYQNPTTKKYKDGTSFEEIVALYKFDENLRELFLKYLLFFEINMRSLISYYFTQTHGVLQSAYLTTTNFDFTASKKTRVLKLIDIFNKAITSKDCAYIKYQRDTYNNVPLWVLVKELTFGNISIMYFCLSQSMQSKISKNFDKINESDMAQYLKVLSKFRNVCAHNERLFSYRTRDSIPDTTLHRKLEIPKQGTQFVNGKQDLFAVVISLRYFLPSDEYLLFKRKLGSIISDFCRQTTHVTEADLLKQMGFPNNWKNISKYKP